MWAGLLRPILRQDKALTGEAIRLRFCLPVIQGYTPGSGGLIVF